MNALQTIISNVIEELMIFKHLYLGLVTRDPCKKCIVRPMCSQLCDDKIDFRYIRFECKRFFDNFHIILGIDRSEIIPLILFLINVGTICFIVVKLISL